MLRKIDNKAQFSMQFNWLFVLIAGAIILILFLSFGFRFQESSDTRANVALLNKMSNIFSSVKSTNRLVTSLNIPNTKLEFICDEDYYSGYRLVDGEAFMDNNYDPLFSPTSVDTDELNVWSMEFKYPFKIMNFLFVTAPNVDYVLIYRSNDLFASAFVDEFREVLNQYDNFQIVEADQKYSPPTHDHIRFVFLGKINPSTYNLGLSLRDKDVSAVQIIEDEVVFYTKKANMLVEEGDCRGGDCGINYLSTLTDDPNPVIYGAIFSDNNVSYLCNMQKAFSRMSLILELGMNRFNELYGCATSSAGCCAYIDWGGIDDAKTKIDNFCVENIIQNDGCLDNIPNINRAMKKLVKDNIDLQTQGCISFY